MTIIVSDNVVLKSKEGPFLRPSDLVGEVVSVQGAGGTFIKVTSKPCVSDSVSLYYDNGIRIDVAPESLLRSQSNKGRLVSWKKSFDFYRGEASPEEPWYNDTVKGMIKQEIDISDYSYIGEGKITIPNDDFLRMTGWWLAGGYIEPRSGIFRLYKSVNNTPEDFELLKRLDLKIYREVKYSMYLMPHWYLDVLSNFYGFNKDRCIVDDVLLHANVSEARTIISSYLRAKATSGRNFKRAFKTRCSKEFMADFAILCKLGNYRFYVKHNLNDTPANPNTSERVSCKMDVGPGNRMDWASFGILDKMILNEEPQQMYTIDVLDKKITTGVWISGFLVK